VVNPHKADAPMLDRAAGALLGLAVGDALGAGYEFATPPTGDAEMIGGGLGNWARGEWTDDTQMAICIAQETATGNLDAAAVGRRFLGWLADDPPDVGIQTRSVLSAAGHGSGLHAAAADHFARNPKGAAGNGSLMRTAPVALAHLGDDEAIVRAAHDISALTHADPLAGQACAIWCIAIDRAVRESRLDGVWDGVELLEPDAQRRWAAWLREAETQPPSTFSPNGFVVPALQAAWAAIYQTPIPSADGRVPCEHLQRALHAAVRIGHDTDTVAAIAGSLLGARWGATAIPLRWRSMLHGWPGLHADDLARLAVLSARRGTVDDLGWPTSPDLGPSYAQRYRIEPFVVPLADDPGVILGNSISAAAAEADVMVSLCRMGRTQPAGVDRRHELIVVDSSHPRQNPNLLFSLRDTAATIAAWRDDGQTVFLHCVAGVSRTSVYAAAYVAHRLGISGAEALERVTACHPVADPNHGFRAALEHL
jgi:ADP-ribosyl-[dinitrogen reductase] hydrolase